MRGRRRAALLVNRAVDELRNARLDAGLTQGEVARSVGVTKAQLSRLEAGHVRGVTIQRLSEVASVLGYEVSLGLHPVGDPVRDKGQLAVARRLDSLLSPAWRVTNEALLPGPGEQRAWDKLLRLVASGRSHLVGVDIETRVRDVQALTRRTRARERDGMVDAILIVLSDSANNRRLVDDLRASLGANYATSPRVTLAALRSGQRLIGSGVVLI
jgi:transcriptional regulator with XRE-family HTH domain